MASVGENMSENGIKRNSFANSLKPAALATVVSIAFCVAASWPFVTYFRVAAEHFASEVGPSHDMRG
jgi:hypothetical protein